MRFMIHPLKAASSFECDGCGHHASFHKMDNQKEEEIISRWKVEKAEKTNEGQQQGEQRLLTDVEVVDDILEYIEQAPKRRRVVDLSGPLRNRSTATTRKRTRERRT